MDEPQTLKPKFIQRELELQQNDAVPNTSMKQQVAYAAGIICPKCGTMNDSDAVYCASCGSFLHMGTCPHCGCEIEPDVDFCEACHHYIRPDICSFCGFSFSEVDAYCPSCGMPRGGVVCPTCHTLNDFSFCKQCGQPLTEEAKSIMQQMRQMPEYKTLMALSHEYNELQMQLPYETEADKEKGEALEALRERVLKLLAQDQGQTLPDVPAPRRRRLTKEQLAESRRRKLEQLAEVLDKMAIPESTSSASVRNYAMAQKPAGVRLAWVCNYKHALHSSPCGCAKPKLGGKWVILGHNSKQEIKDDK